MIENDLAQYSWTDINDDLHVYFNDNFDTRAVSFGRSTDILKCSLYSNEVAYRVDLDIDAMFDLANDLVTAYMVQEHNELKAKAAELRAKRIEELETELNNIKNK